MKYAKILGLLAVAAAALMAFAGSASAGTLTNPVGTTLGAGSVIHAIGEKPHTRLDGTVTVTCEESTVEGKITEPHVVKGTIETLTFTKCGSTTVTVVDDANGHNGTLEINSNTEVFSSGAHVTVLTHNILGTIHCIYATNNTKVGTLTDSTTTGKTATLDIGSAPIPQTVTDGACKNDALWTGNYEIDQPDRLYHDK